MLFKTKSDCVVALFLVIITLILCAIKIIHQGYAWSDDAGYIAQAIALANGTTAQYIADNTLMMTKCDWLYGPYAYPWGFPMLLAPLYKIFGFNIVAFKSVGIICYALFVGIFYIFCAHRLPKIYAIFATLFFAINPTMISFVAHNILSDTPFLLFGFIALIILARLFGESLRKNGVDCHDFLRKSRNDGIYIAIFGGIFMLFATMIRINGLVILCALIAMQGILLAKRFAPNLTILKPFSRIDSPYSWKIHAIPHIIFIIGFSIVSLTLSSGGSGHWSELANISIESILYNLYSYSVRFNEVFNLQKIDFALLALCLAPFLLLGIRECLKSSESSATIFYVIFACGFFALLLLWLETSGLRFVLLLLPFLVFWSVNGLAKAKKIYGYAMSAVLLVILCSFVPSNMLDLDFKDKEDRMLDVAVSKYSDETMQIWDFIKQNTPSDSLIISIKPRAVYLYTHRLSFATTKIERLDEADFVLWWADFIKLNIFSKDFKAKTQLIFQNSEYKLFKVLK